MWLEFCHKYPYFNNFAILLILSPFIHFVKTHWLLNVFIIQRLRYRLEGDCSVAFFSKAVSGLMKSSFCSILQVTYIFKWWMGQWALARCIQGIIVERIKIYEKKNREATKCLLKINLPLMGLVTLIIHHSIRHL